MQHMMNLQMPCDPLVRAGISASSGARVSGRLCNIGMFKNVHLVDQIGCLKTFLQYLFLTVMRMHESQFRQSQVESRRH